MDTLLVEDDPAIARALSEGLARYGFVVRHVQTGAEALRDHPGAAVVLLDLGLPDGDGIDVCRSLRAVSDVPIIIITARSDEVERVVGLEVGADDYLPKPFGLRELVARMRAVLRRTESAPALSAALSTALPAAPVEDEAPVRVGRLRFHQGARRVFVDPAPGQGPDPVEVTLAAKEFDLLAQLVSAPGLVRTREELLAQVWDENFHGSTRTLDVHVGALRRKLSGAAVEVQTVRGVGFRLEAVPG